MNETHASPLSSSQDPQTLQIGGAIIDAKGHEIPITEQMIRQALQELEMELEDSLVVISDCA